MFNQTKHKSWKNFCMYCLQSFSSEHILNKHIETCISINGKRAIKVPEKDGNILKYNTHCKQLQVPFVIHSDFESITKKIQGCKPNNDESFTEAYQKHEDCGYSYKVVCCYDGKLTNPLQVYRGENAAYNFLESMLKEVQWCEKMKCKHFNKDLTLTKDEELSFNNSEECHICNVKYSEKDIRVRDHCHITRKYRRSAHQECNLKLSLTDRIPIVFHNLRGYDSHLIAQQVGRIVKNHT